MSRFKMHAPLLILGLLLSAGAFAQEPGAAEAASEAAGEAMTGIVPLLSRWLHVLGAIFLLGGALYLRTVLMPAASETLDDATHQQLREGVMARWRKLVGILILVLLLTGLFNYMYVTRFGHDENPTYHMLFGIKFLLAFVVFALASMLAGRKKISQKLQEKAGLWLGITIATGIAIVLIAGYMKMM